MTRNYEVEKEKLAKANTIAIEALQKFKPIELDEKQGHMVINFYLRIQENFSNPRPKTQTLGYLKDETKFIFTYFNEGSGEAVEYFWKRLKEEGLNYKRVNKLDKILKRKRIKNHEEYDFLTDAVVPLRQQGEITEEQFQSLTTMLGDFEARVR